MPRATVEDIFLKRCSRLVERLEERYQLPSGLAEEIALWRITGSCNIHYVRNALNRGRGVMKSHFGEADQINYARRAWAAYNTPQPTPEERQARLVRFRAEYAQRPRDELGVPLCGRRRRFLASLQQQNSPSNENGSGPSSAVELASGSGQTSDGNETTGLSAEGSNSSLGDGNMPMLERRIENVSLQSST
jgi:hypothetical protein